MFLVTLMINGEKEMSSASTQNILKALGFLAGALIVASAAATATTVIFDYVAFVFLNRG